MPTTLTAGPDIVAVQANLKVSVNGAAAVAADTLYDGAAGSDTVDLTFATYVTAGSLFTLTATAAGILTFTSGTTVIDFQNFETVSFGGGVDIALGTAGDDTITGGGKDDLFLYGLGGSDTIDGGAGADAMYGGAGDDSYKVDDAGDLVVEGLNGGTDSIESKIDITALAANVENLTLAGLTSIDGTGNGLDNVVIGNAAANILKGLAGDDTLNGGGGADSLQGGAGNDTYIIGNAGVVVVEALNDGIDLVRASVDHTLAANVDNLVLTGTASIDGTGNALSNVITGNSGINILSGGAGDDTLDGLAGIDTLIGGAGDDTYMINAAGDTITEALNDGMDEVRSSVTIASLAANVENLTLTGVANIDGSGNALNNIITGNSGANILSGGAGDDTLDGLAGSDTLIGGAGDDIYMINAAGDTITEALNDGTDEVRSSVTIASLAANVEKLTLTGAAAINGTGNALNNTITGNAGDNLLSGGGGTDTITGGGGSDTLVVTGVSDDYTVQSLNATQSRVIDSRAGRDGTITFSGVEFIQFSDTKIAVTSFGAGSNVINGTANDDTLPGTGANDTINGLGGNDTLGGSAGNDILAGGTGNDIFIVNSANDQVKENLNEGTDEIRASVSFTLSANVENGLLTGTNAINLTGNALNNTLTGNAGANQLSGGGGNDIYYIDNLDAVIENSGNGTDEIRAGFSVNSLAENVENLTLLGSAALNGTGNSLNNVITGNSGANELWGGGGVDTLIGNGGNDTYIVDTEFDVVVETSTGGTDTIESSSARTYMADYVENLVLTSGAVSAAYGNGLDNVMTGTNLANSLDGGGGNDRMEGLGGADVYVVDSVGDVVIEAINGGYDQIFSSVSIGQLAANVERLDLMGSASINGSGNELNNFLLGNSGNNVLNGLGGADRMKGGLGNDTYYIDNAGDLATEVYGQGIDSVISSVDLVLPANIENLSLTGTAQKASGNALDNVIRGNAAGNILTGWAGADKMDGGQGRDIFIYANIKDSRPGALHDTIWGFGHAVDRIDLSLIDANGSSGGDGTFKFNPAAGAQFNGDNGQLRYFISGNQTIIQGDVNGDKLADFEIALDGHKVLTAGDFIL